MAADHSSSRGRQDGPAGLRVPTRNEQQIALVLLGKVIVSETARGQIEQIARGQPVHEEALSLMRKFEETYVKKVLAKRVRPTG